MGDITSNFSYSEFRPYSAPYEWRPSSDYSKMLLDNLAKNLQVIHDALPYNVTMRISSGVRTLSDYNRLVKQGYNPSVKSDHYCGEAVPLEVGSNNYNKYGATYNFAVGAADIVTMGIDIIKLFDLAIRRTIEGKCSFGQVIYEYNPNDKDEWVHFGNDPSLVFSANICAFLNRGKFLKSVDGGKTYSVVKPS